MRDKIGVVMMGQCFGRWLRHRSENYRGRVVGVVQEPEHEKWFLVLAQDNKAEGLRYVEYSSAWEGWKWDQR